MSLSRDERDPKLGKGQKGPEKEKPKAQAGESLEGPKGKTKPGRTTSELPAPSEPTSDAPTGQGAPEGPSKREAYLAGPATEGQLNAVKDVLAKEPGLTAKLPADFEQKQAAGELKVADIEEVFRLSNINRIREERLDASKRPALFRNMDQALKEHRTVKEGNRDVPAIFRTTVEKVKAGKLDELNSLEARQAVRFLAKDPNAPATPAQQEVASRIFEHMTNSAGFDGKSFDAHVRDNVPETYDKLYAEGISSLTHGDVDALIALESAYNKDVKVERDAARDKMLKSPATKDQLKTVAEILEAHPGLAAKLPEDFASKQDGNQLLGADIDLVFKADRDRRKDLVNTAVGTIKEMADEDLAVVAQMYSSRLEEESGKTFKENFVKVQEDKLKALKADPESKEFKNAFFDFVQFNRADALTHALEQFAQV